jgi:hydroxymethylpyrimidine kinase/phosphomethylpyrimidine kinase
MTKKQSPTNNIIVLTIAGSDSGGGAGIAADLKTFAALGVHGTYAITSVTAQNTIGVLETFDLPAAAVISQIEAVCMDMDIKWIKTGMLASSEIIREVAKEVKKHDLSLVLDPVIAAEAGGNLLREESLPVLIEELLPLCKVITPNALEAGALAGISVKSPEDAKIAAKKIADLCVEAVIITGGHLDATDLLYETYSDTFTSIPGTFVSGGTHGSGCTYSAAMTACLAFGKSLEEAARESKQFVMRAIMKSKSTGRGVNPVNQLGTTLEEKERYLVLRNLKEAILILEKSPDFQKYISEVGCNIGMAIPDAQKSEEVAAVKGGILRYRELAIQIGCVEFGASRHIAKIILSALRCNPKMRAAINIRYSESNLSLCREAGFSLSSFSRAEEPKNRIISNGWTTEAVQTQKRIHKVVYDTGYLGKEPMIHLFGTNAVEIAKFVVELAEKS